MGHHIAFHHEGSGHVHHPFHLSGNGRIPIQGCRQVGSTANGHQGHLSRILPDGPDNEIGCRLLPGLQFRFPVVPFPVYLLPGSRTGIAGGSFMAVEILSVQAFFFRHMGKPVFPGGFIHPHEHRDILPSHPFQLTDGRCGPGFHPGVPKDDGHPFQLDVGGLGQHHHGHPVIQQFHHIRIQDHLFLLSRQPPPQRGQDRKRQDPHNTKEFSEIILYLHCLHLLSPVYRKQEISALY